MRVLVTGGAGFVGSHVVDELVAGGVDVRVVDCLHPAAHAGEPDDLHPEVEYLWGDLADPDVARRAVDGVDAVSHQAAMVGLGVDFSDAGDYVVNNDLATARLLAALHAGRFAGRLVLAGSMVVYGEGSYRCGAHGAVRPGPRDPDRLAEGEFEPPCPRCGAPLEPEAVNEDAPADPRNVYAATKLHQEHLFRAFGREHRAPVCVLRYHNVYGPRMPRDTPYAGVAAVFRSALARHEPPRVFEDGRQRRDFVHVSDVARANVLALCVPDPIDAVLNVASGEPRSVVETAEALSAALGGPAPEVVGGFRLGDVRHVFASTDRAREVLGFSTTVPFVEGMRAFASAPLRS